jgi:hypothetical protein
MSQITKQMVLAGLYVYCYCISAVLFRNTLLADQLRPTFNWVVVLLMLGLGTAIPSLVAAIFFYDQFSGRNNELSWWILTNPFLSLYETGSGSWRNNDFETLLFIFLGTWAMGASLLLMPWYTRQFKAFRPLRENLDIVAQKETPAVAPVTKSAVLDKPATPDETAEMVIDSIKPAPETTAL